MDTIENSVPIIRPTLPPLEKVLEAVSSSYDSGLVTIGRNVRLFEEEMERFTGAKHAVAVSSCTAGLMLAFAALDLPEGADVVVPSFTFAATVQALLWNGLTPVFVDCLPGTMTIDPDQVADAIGPRTMGICPVSIYGLPPDIEQLTDISAECEIPLIFDSAQGLGSTYRGVPAGASGLCEVFSLSPTKVITAVEGGVITTNNTPLADKLRCMRDYGKGADGEEIVFNGLSARMSELHACVGLLNLRNAEKLVSSRLRLIHRYRKVAGNLHGCTVQEFPTDRTTSGNYFTLLVGTDAKVDRDGLWEALQARNIQSKRYFFPPVHAQAAFKTRPHKIVGELSATWSCSQSSLALPLFSHMTDEEHDRVCEALLAILG